MKVTLKNIEISLIMSALSNLEEMDMDIELGHKLGIIQVVLTPFAEKADKKREDLVNKNAEKDEEGNLVIPKDENGNPLKNQVKLKSIKAFQKDLQKFMKQDIEIDIPVKVTLEDFKNSDIKLKMKTMRDLHPIIYKEDESIIEEEVK